MRATKHEERKLIISAEITGFGAQNRAAINVTTFIGDVTAQKRIVSSRSAAYAALLLSISLFNGTASTVFPIVTTEILNSLFLALSKSGLSNYRTPPLPCCRSMSLVLLVLNTKAQFCEQVNRCAVRVHPVI